MKKSNVAAVVVTFNRIALVMKCLSALQTQTIPCDILLVDNASTDGTAQEVHKLLGEQVQYRNTGTNLGGAGGFHYGMCWAIEAGYDYVWVMDDDCAPQPNALKELLDADQLLDGRYGFLCSAVLWTDGNACMMNRQKVKKNFYNFLPLLKHGIVQVEQATFVSLLIPVSVIRQVGLPIRKYFIWGDDIEYTRRIAVRHEIPCFLVGKSQTIHLIASNNGSSIATDVPQRIGRYRYAYRNESHLYRQEGLSGFLYYTAKCLYHSLRILRYSKDHRLQRLGIIFGQYWAGFFFNPPIEKIATKNNGRQV